MVRGGHYRYFEVVFSRGNALRSAFHGILSSLESQTMHHFHYAGQNLHCESVDLAEVAKLYGTPTYVYSAATLADNYARLDGSMKGLDVRVCYSIKANSNLAVLRHLHNLGSAFDFVSGGEMRRVIAAGGNVKESVFAGVGKTDSE